jgi:hypothetical protein
MASKAIDKFNEIKIVMDAYSAIDNMTEEAFYKSTSMGITMRKILYSLLRVLAGQSPQSNPMLT